ncbi:ETX/MTX2 family pore-forming toxin [Acidicapsa dinghuensis]|uniref:ETX/MTX2 family pore-forming toxin n=1 Tax=Acidicapsa dinghuensis TaxID=2218256 RepID=A0ABW1EKX4_9BACT|nr:ETX/MTX2 family pore-forming toxin [Acidicapsa dinghuensis]
MSFIFDAWQSKLNTDLDPANGQWFTNGPGNNGGLYGKLTDSLATELIFKESQKTFSTRLFSADSNIVDNRNGLQSDVTTTLTYQYTNQSSLTHSTTNGLKVSAGLKITNKTTLGVPATGANETTVEVSFNTEYSYSWTDTSSRQVTETQTVSRSTKLAVPNGKVYQQVLTCNKDKLVIPFTANIYLAGTSAANFKADVNGKSNHTANAGDICDWINQYKTAGDSSSQYGRDPSDPTRGAIGLAGVMTAEQSRNFMVYTIDVTDSYTGKPGAGPSKATQADLASSLAAANVVSSEPVK